MRVVFSDLDGTLLDHHTYDWNAARPALQRLEETGTPCVLVTSKTRAEVEVWRRTLGNCHPFVVENGGAAFMPAGYFRDVPGSVRRDEYRVLEWGARYEELVKALDAASQSTECRVSAFSRMTTEEVAADSGLSLDQAALAKQREYDEPFQVLDAERTGALTDALERSGYRWTRGGRYYHVTGNNDKALAVRAVADLYRQKHGRITTIGLGDGLNDLPFLEAVDVPVIVRSRSSGLMSQRLPHSMVTTLPGPAGWNEAILELVPP